MRLAPLLWLLSNISPREGMMSSKVGLKTLAEYAVQHLGAPTLSAGKRMVRRKQVFVNDRPERRTDYVVLEGDEVELRPTREKSGNFSSWGLKDNVKLDIVYEDDHIAVVVKPAGMPVFQTKNVGAEDGHSIRTALLTNLKSVTAPGLNPLHRPQPVHRLDRDTHGLLLCAKTRIALSKCSDMFKDRDVEKRYRAIVAGIPDPPQGSIECNIQSKMALSHYEVLRDDSARGDTTGAGWTTTDPATGRALSTLSVRIETGRKNQIRRHMAMIGHPIMGDRKCWKNPPWDPDFPAMNGLQGECDGGQDNAVARPAHDDEAGTTCDAGSYTADGVSGCNSHDDEVEEREEEDDDGGTAADEYFLGLCLSAVMISFEHPITNENLSFEIDEPDHFQKVRNAFGDPDPAPKIGRKRKEPSDK